ncbi:hypothetical protein CBS147321_7789 [Aspergillus niger]|nr:hypothetical protein CBS133816_7328 [Aspergillus niger]KAI2855078.1 hypothetical protein CBS12448_7458 [Aspergillus niger]KAI2937479.1 hypothetical protein CBS147321_7789 [Aspergillus niger]KAI2939752.1 hypothetical protein CBS147322_10043 [Aspergillus niger]KAI2966103.1 hypothetical protein CBS147324_7662 [Aspergillus niger]
MMGWNGPRTSGWNSGLVPRDWQGERCPQWIQEGWRVDNEDSLLLLLPSAEQEGQAEKNNVKSPLLRKNESAS